MDMELVVKFHRRDERVVLPEYESEGAAGMDMRAFLPDGEITLAPLERRKVPTGLSVEIPEGYEAQIRPRSGLAAREGVTILNSPGTIDSDFRGELDMLLVNFGAKNWTVRNGDRIAQMVIAPVSRARIDDAPSLSETGRGAGGWGSTGIY
jgi:dUTP pyrophosphatase